MRKRDTVKIDDKEITVKELTVREILELTNSEAFKGGALTEMNMAVFKDHVAKFLPAALEGATMEDLMNMAPSEIKTIFECFKAVNSVFFDAARTAGLNKLMSRIGEAIQQDFLKLLAGS